MTQEEQHLDLLAIFHFVVGGLTALFSCIFFLHVAIGIAMLNGVFDKVAPGSEAPPAFLAWFFIIFPSIFIVAGWILAGLMIAVGRKLKRRASHTFCMIVAGMECILMPFGTVLGIFTIVLLMKDPVKRLFGVGTVGEGSRPQA